jgi:hypothetical protein
MRRNRPLTPAYLGRSILVAVARAAKSCIAPARAGSAGRVAVYILTIMGLALAGCGDDRPTRVKVSGQVLIDGQPLTFGHVRFVPKGARPSEGSLDENGRFTLTCYDGEDGAVPGVHRVEVAAGEPLSSTQMRWHAPKKYADFSTSGLEQEITGDTDSVVIELHGDGGKPFKPFVEGSPSRKPKSDQPPTRGNE